MNYIRGSVLLGIGLVGGFLTGYYLGKKMTEKAKDEEVQEIRDFYREKAEEINKEYEKLKEQKFEIDKVTEEYLEGDKKLAETGDLGPSRGSERTDYHKVGKEKEIKMAENEVPEEEKPDSPYFITEDEFLNDCNEYDKLSFTYYMVDQTLVDDSDELCDIDETISSDIYNQLGTVEGDVYVRNDTSETDFEIVRIDRSYTESYGGY